jgi:hypothetical protein
MLIDDNTTYYVSDFNGTIFILNDSWEYIDQKSFIKPAYMLTFDQYIYIAADKNISKTDKYLNILNQYNYSGETPSYRGIYHNSTCNLLFVTAGALKLIQVFDMNLLLIANESISTSPYHPRSITGYENRLYVGVATNGTILVIVNKMIISLIYSCDGKHYTITSILYDQSGQLATTCEEDSHFYLHLNGSFTGKKFSSKGNAEYIGFDSKRNFIIISTSEINIYS